MPVHDWTRVVAGIFHDFHQRWVSALARALNDGRIPNNFYALSERVAAEPTPGPLEAMGSETAAWDSDQLRVRVSTAMERPRRMKYTEAQERDIYAESADRVAIRHASGDQIVAYIEIVSPGNKHTPYALSQFVEKLDEAWHQGNHLLVVDVHPPGKHDPRGVHSAFWQLRSEESHGVTAEEPLGLSAYRADDVPRGYFERIAVGQCLPDMPVFLTPTHYVNVPLEQTYMESYRGVPQRWKQVIEGRA